MAKTVRFTQMEHGTKEGHHLAVIREGKVTRLPGYSA